ncbi:TIGR00341 family protein [Hugenholtzia roseola]|uniref:TIGR00341 family protein n=1 Tax=Hugenholtzia roseola TaxID=1002 RepID=UPI0004203236|nr:TIGR00341 family protein [Hugenholtzia roseola]
MENLIFRVRTFLNIRDSSDIPKTISEIETNIELKGYNVWILACAALLASIGLDTNSTAVIIGAMLISPLMSPILGVGLSLGIQDREMLIRSVRNLAVATLASLGTSFIYFNITPLGEATPEILARTQPTLLDVAVALFGGIAGIVSGSRKEKTNAIPGVAIATALMPPLCASGFGLATGNWAVFLGAFYLFFINAVFISLSTFVVVKYLRFPVKEYLDKKTENKVTRLLLAFLIVILTPSVYFLYTVYQQTQTQKLIETLVINKLRTNESEVLKWEVYDADSLQQVKIYLSGTNISEAQKQSYDSTLAANGLKKHKVSIFRVNMSREEVAKLSAEVMQNTLKTIEIQTRELAAKVEEKKEEILQQEQNIGELRGEMEALFPDLEHFSMGEVVSSRRDSLLHLDTLTTVIISWKMPQEDPKISRYAQQLKRQEWQAEKAEKNQKLYRFFKQRLNKDTLYLVNEPLPTLK